MKVKEVFLFDNGVSCAFDSSGKQTGGVRSWFLVTVDQMEKDGIDISDVFFKMPNGKRVRVLKDDNGNVLRDDSGNVLNWEFV